MLLIISSIIFSIEPIRKSIITLLRKEEIIKNIGYEVYSNENNKIRILLKFTDTENGIEEIRLPDGDKLIANGQNEIGLDYIIESDGEYTFISKSTTGEEMTETINVNEEYRNNLIGIEKIQEISTEQDYSIIKRYDGESPYTYYYAIGENNTEWIQIPEYLIVNVDSYKVNELDWKNEDGTVTLKVKKVGKTGNTVEVKKIIEDLNTAGIEFKEEEKVIEGESIIACVRDNELESGNYRLKVNGEEYPAEIYNYDDENVNYITDKNLGTREADNRMLIMKYNKNLTVNQERIVTAETRKKGMFIYVEEELTNDGTIDMTSKGANAEGQDVYLWKNDDNSYEYVPAVGATGGAGTYGYSIYKKDGWSGYKTETVNQSANKGNDGTGRQTGGGGSGSATASGGDYTQKCTAHAYGGAGGKGTSYSGGNDGENASASTSPGYVSRSVTGKSGTDLGGNAGGLLIISGKSILNKGNILSNGVEGQYRNGTGGGSINIFYRNIVEGNIQAVGKKGGNGCITLQNINIKSPTVTVDEITDKSFKVTVTDPNLPRDNVRYDYYVNDEIKISNSKLLEETIEGLNPETEYKVKISACYEGITKVFSNEVIIETPKKIIYVGMDGDDTTGDGTELKPYASIEKAIEVAHNGEKIHIQAGTYNLKPMYSGVSDNSAGAGGLQDNYALAGITDKNKKLEIYGENEKTILIYDGTLCSTRDAPAIFLWNKESVIRNITYVFKPKSGETYTKAIFRWCNGTVYNVFFRISGDNKASYLYYNNQTATGSNNVINCTFFHDLGAVDENYSGSCNFTNIATNVNTIGTNTNVITQNFGSATSSILELLENSKENEAFISNQVGVYYGTYAWKK